MKIDIMSGRCTEKEKGDFHGERSRGDHEQRGPSHGILWRWSKRMQTGIATQDGVSSGKIERKGTNKSNSSTVEYADQDR